MVNMKSTTKNEAKNLKCIHDLLKKLHIKKSMQYVELQRTFQDFVNNHTKINCTLDKRFNFTTNRVLKIILLKIVLDY